MSFTDDDTTMERLRILVQENESLGDLVEQLEKERDSLLRRLRQYEEIAPTCCTPGGHATKEVE
jgi:hypothetical protein